MTIVTKQCSRCRRHLPLECFYLDKYHKHGRFPRCRECDQAHQRQRRSTEKGRLARRKKAKRYRERYPEKARAGDIARKAYGPVGRGACAQCGQKEQLQKHHPSYEDPLNVVLLCQSCHNRLHGLARAKQLKGT